MLRAFTCGILLLTGAAVQAQHIYKCADATGRMHYSDKPCVGEGGGKRVRVQDNAIDASYSREQVQRQRMNREAQLNSESDELEVAATLGAKPSNVNSYECRLARENSRRQSMNATRQQIEADLRRADAACGVAGQTPPRGLSHERPARARKTPDSEAPDLHQPSQVVNCDPAGCWDTRGNRLNGVGGGNFTRSDGKFCTRISPNQVQCN